MTFLYTGLLLVARNKHNKKSHFKLSCCFGNLLSFSVSVVLYLEEFFISIGVTVVERIR